MHAGALDAGSVAHYGAQGQQPVVVDVGALSALGVRVVTADIAESDRVVRHEPERLADVLAPLAAEGAARRAESAAAYVAEPH